MKTIALLCFFLLSRFRSRAFSFHGHGSTTTRMPSLVTTCLSASPLQKNNDSADVEDKPSYSSRRDNLQQLASVSFVGFTSTFLFSSSPALADTFADREAQRKFIQESYEDFERSNEGWLYREVKAGTGDNAKEGDRVVFDWSGYTIGYFGRPFQAKGGPQGGAFDKDLDYERTIIGSGKIIKGLELALKDMKAGSVRQVVIPYGELSYPADDSAHDRVGPKPTTFSGQRALNFVLDNPRLDRTLLFNVKVVRVDKSDGKGGFFRG